MRSSFVAAAGLALMLAVPTVGQATAKPDTKQDSKPAAPAAPAKKAPAGEPSAPPADAPMEVFTPPATKSPAEGWSDADKSADAIKLGQTFLSASQQAYAAAGELAEEVQLDMAAPTGKITQKMNMAFGKDGDMRLSAPGIEIIVVKGNVYVVPEQPADKYVEQAKSGTTMQPVRCS